MIRRSLASCCSCLGILISKEAEVASFLMQEVGRIDHCLIFLRYVIKKTTGMTALDIIANVVIMDAKAQLKSTNLPIKEISIGLGYSNVAFFDKYFRRYVGMSPLEYRNS